MEDPKNPKDFQQRFSEALAATIGADWESRSNAQILTLGGLSISEETLRKIRFDGYIPSVKYQTKILQELRAAKLETAMHFTESGAAREEVRALLGIGLAEVSMRSLDPRLPCDLVLQDKGLGLSSYIVRCLDDFAGQHIVPPRYFSEVIEHLAVTMQKLGSSQGVIITHRRYTKESEDQAAKASITLRSYDEFVQSRLSKVEIRTWLARMRAERGLSAETFASLRADTVSRGKAHNVDALEALYDNLTNTAGAAMVTILGSFGTGKTSTMLTLAERLAQEEQSGRGWVLPLWIEAAALGGDVSEALQAAIARVSPDSPLPLESVKKLISRGKLWLFVDALDEALALSNVDDLKRFVEGYARLLRPHGRLVVSARQEMFNSVNDELAVFEGTTLHSMVDSTLVLRMNSMSRETAKGVIRNRLAGPSRFTAQVLARIESDDVLSDLITRPIFMYIATTAATSAMADTSGSGVAALFEAYVKQWSFREQEFLRQPRMPTEDRLLACELLALHHMIFGAHADGYSVNDLRKFVESDLTVGMEIKNIDMFVYEARIAMFLERRRDDHFEFSHASMREFFLARRAARELREAASLAASRDRSLLPYALKTLGRVPLRRGMTLARKFTIELCATNRAEAKRLIESILAAARDWSGHHQDDALLTEEIIEAPPFGPGRYRYLIPNLAALLQTLQDLQPEGSLDLDGAYLPWTNLGELFLPSHPCQVRLRRANLAHSQVPQTKDYEHIKFISDGALLTSGDAGQYCQQNGLFERAPFNDRIGNEFVLIPGGEYVVTGDQDHPRHVRVGPYLMQRYPVTNRQFWKFLQQHPEWAPDDVRRRTQNDYYLGYWPLNPKSDVLTNPDWLDRPVVQVSWRAAAAFAAAAGMRLPTEVEWEIAARRGQTNLAHLRPWGESLRFDGQIAAVAPNEQERADPAQGSRVPTVSVLDEDKVPGFAAWKLQLGNTDVPSHMIGLVREWVLDIWSDDFPLHTVTSGFDDPVCLVPQRAVKGASHLVPTGDVTATRVLRGGGFNSPDAHLNVRFRAPHRSLNVNPDVGFRCVRPIRLSSSRN